MINLSDNKKTVKLYITTFFKWVFLGLTVGAVCGLIGFLFDKSVGIVTDFRAQNSWVLYLLPIGAMVSVGVYKLCGVCGVGTNQVFESVRSEQRVSPLLAPTVFIGSVITHLFGGSAGREGAALQIGGSISAFLGELLKLDKKSRHILTVCGMAALFSAIFGTPLGALVFAIEVVSVGQIGSALFLPGIVASITAYGFARFLGVEAEQFFVENIPQFNFITILRVAVIAVIGAVISVFFCFAIRYTHKFFAKYFRNEFLRISVGGVLIVLLTLVLGTTDYNGSGIEIINGIFKGEQVKYEAFLLKIIFTAITVSVGFKGGEIIPTLFIGATLGASLSGLLGLNPAFCAAIGMAALFCGVTNCPLATIVLFTELFGTQSIIFIAFAGIISFFLSGYTGLYSGQHLVFSKFTEEEIDISPKE